MIGRISRGCRVFLVGAALASAAGCGLAPSNGPEILPSDAIPAPAATARPTAATTTSTTIVYFARNGRLTAVRRGATGVNAADSVIGILLAGPTADEAHAGIRTALPPDLHLTVRTDTTGVTSVTLPHGSIKLPAGDQVMAFAQIVWTLATLPGRSEVRFTDGSRPVAVPTDGGQLQNAPVRRTDYGSVAPS